MLDVNTDSSPPEGAPEPPVNPNCPHTGVSYVLTLVHNQSGGNISFRHEYSYPLEFPEAAQQHLAEAFRLAIESLGAEYQESTFERRDRVVTVDDTVTDLLNSPS